MKILGIETTTKKFCLGLYDNGKIYTHDLELGRLHSQLAMPAIMRAIAALGWRIKDIDYFACGLGPGSFTGVRIGLSLIKGLAFGLNKPVIGIPSLDILALNAEGRGDKMLVPAVDAKRNLIYCGFYRMDNGVLKKIKPYALLSPEELSSRIKSPAIIFGDALIAHKEVLRNGARNSEFLDKDHWSLEARNMIHLSLEKIRKQDIKDSFGVTPIYLYPKECQIQR